MNNNLDQLLMQTDPDTIRIGFHQQPIQIIIFINFWKVIYPDL